jgi:hypothetical protein
MKRYDEAFLQFQRDIQDDAEFQAHKDRAIKGNVYLEGKRAFGSVTPKNVALDLYQMNKPEPIRLVPPLVVVWGV